MFSLPPKHDLMVNFSPRVWAKLKLLESSQSNWAEKGKNDNNDFHVPLWKKDKQSVFAPRERQDWSSLWRKMGFCETEVHFWFIASIPRLPNTASREQAKQSWLRPNLGMSWKCGTWFEGVFWCPGRKFFPRPRINLEMRVQIMIVMVAPSQQASRFQSENMDF